MKNLVKTPKLPIAKIAKLMELEAQSKKINEQINKYRAELLEVTQALDVLTLKTGKYTISRATRLTPRVLDFKTLCKSLDRADIPYETEETFTPQMSVLFRQLAKENRELAGLETQETEYITIRINENGQK